MHRVPFVIFLMTVLWTQLGVHGRAAEGPGAELDSAKVESSIKQGVEYLWRMQHNDGGWDEHPAQQNCGVSALVALVTSSPILKTPALFSRTCVPRSLSLGVSPARLVV